MAAEHRESEETAELLLERFKTREYNFYKGRKIVNVFRDGKKWYEVAIRVLENEEILRSVLFTTVYNALSKGKGKCRKMHVHGTSDCGKNFILLPLKISSRRYLPDKKEVKEAPQKADSREYEKTRWRKFSSKWQVGRPWLKDDENGVTYAKHKKSISDYKWLCDLDEAKGLTLGRTYRNINSCTTFIKYITRTAMDQVADEMKKA
ncbi:hypothetical protein P5673_011931 [Acropora cervicornis]|uniref:Uncharacterized protein n=1 Tax=Acropora cervicornis TaxID=6130 RepID=A0AAD9QNN5_ACRCE|nr:hypothetical protein P5673_011931 [Acropora cervicornis]